MKFNKFFKQLAYDVSISGHVKLTPYFDELLNFEQWSNDVIEYITSNPDPIRTWFTSDFGRLSAGGPGCIGTKHL